MQLISQEQIDRFIDIYTKSRYRLIGLAISNGIFLCSFFFNWGREGLSLELLLINLPVVFSPIALLLLEFNHRKELREIAQVSHGLQFNVKLDRRDVVQSLDNTLDIDPDPESPNT